MLAIPLLSCMYRCPALHVVRPESEHSSKDFQFESWRREKSPLGPIAVQQTTGVTALVLALAGMSCEECGSKS